MHTVSKQFMWCIVSLLFVELWQIHNRESFTSWRRHISNAALPQSVRGFVLHFMLISVQFYATIWHLRVLFWRHNDLVRSRDTTLHWPVLFLTSRVQDVQQTCLPVDHHLLSVGILCEKFVSFKICNHQNLISY